MARVSEAPSEGVATSTSKSVGDASSSGAFTGGCSCSGRTDLRLAKRRVTCDES